MESLKEFIKMIIRYAIAGVVIAAITIIICLIANKNYSKILTYVALAVLAMAALGIVGSSDLTADARQRKYTIGVEDVKGSDSSNVLSAVYRAAKLFLTAAVIYGISLI